MKEYTQSQFEHIENLLTFLQQFCKQQGQASVAFEHALEELLLTKAHRRPRTLAEIRSIAKRLMRQDSSLADRQLSEMDAGFCEELISATFSSPRQRAKGRTILHSLFHLACRRRWCYYNPIDQLDAPYIEERPIHPLSWEELRRLLRTARLPQHRPCMPALGLMLWAGLRPAEVERMNWQHLDWEENVVVVMAQHAKTGGCRHVTMPPVLRRWLRQAGVHRAGLICPANWARRWKQLREEAGLLPWRQDVLRHTYASYHAKRWRDFNLLQTEMGHRSAALLRTRYLSMQGVTAQHAREFWQVGAL